MKTEELVELYAQNLKLLQSPGASTSTHEQRIYAEQEAIKSRLGLEAINNGLQRISIGADDVMQVDSPSTPMMIDTKRRVLQRYGPANGGSVMGSLDFQEAVALQQRAMEHDRERKRRAEEKKQRLGAVVESEETRRARILAFMQVLGYKPSDSDLEDDDDDDEEDPDDEETIASWLRDDDDGRQGQDLVEPDPEDYSDIIRADTSTLHYNTFYQPRDEDF
ncbi:hypothetical protein C8J56DRAFT_1047387 [Mycena floridula]|nr:hypothetical protein C8J56DRAFT_1047387 [Mycena floridula]